MDPKNSSDGNRIVASVAVLVSPSIVNTITDRPLPAVNNNKMLEPHKEIEQNVIYTGQGKNHPGLLRNVLFVSNDELHWIREDLALNEGETMDVMARIRYRQPLEKATLHKVASGLYVEFENKQSAITEGQFVAWYNNDELLGSGVIS